MVKNKMAILGGGSGFGKALGLVCRGTYEVKSFNRNEFTLGNYDKIEAVGSYLSSTKPEVIVLNAYSRTRDDPRVAFAQFEALRQLWPRLRVLDTTLIVISSCITWSPMLDDPSVQLYRKSKIALSDFCLQQGWGKVSETERQVKVILYEPATMTNRPELSKERNTPLLSTEDSWALLEAAIRVKLPLIRLGAQGKTLC